MQIILTRILLLLTICFCLINLACVQGSVETISSDTVQASQIYQIYRIEASKSRTEIVAAFRVGGETGTTLALITPAQILHNKQPLPVSAPGNLIGTNYRMKGTDYRTFSDNFQSSHEFSYTDADGKNYVNSINLAPVEISAKGAVSLENDNPTTILLSRTIGADETLTIALDTIIDDEIPTAGNTVYFNEKRNAVIIMPQYWSAKKLKPQTELQIKIKKSGGISNGTPLGGSISAVYKAASLIVNVEPTKKVSTVGSEKNKDTIQPAKSPETQSKTQANANVNRANTDSDKSK